MASHLPQCTDTGATIERSSTRTDRLVAALLTDRDWSSGEPKPIDSQWRAERKAKEAATLARTTGKARTALRKAMDVFKNASAIAEDEAGILADAAQLLASMEMAAKKTQDICTQRTEELKLVDTLRTERARQSIQAQIGTLGIEELVLILRPANNYELIALSAMSPQSLKLSDYKEAYKSVVDEALFSLEVMIKKRIAAGLDAATVAQEIRCRLDDLKCRIGTADAMLVDKIRTLSVAARLIEANNQD